MSNSTGIDIPLYPLPQSIYPDRAEYPSGKNTGIAKFESFKDAAHRYAQVVLMHHYSEDPVRCREFLLFGGMRESMRTRGKFISVTVNGLNKWVITEIRDK